MNNSDSHNSPNNEPSSDGDQALWDIMGKTRKPEASPFFARNVLREVRSQSERTKAFGVFAWLSRPLTLAVVAAVTILLAYSVVTNLGSSPVSEAVITEAFDPAEEMTSIGELGDLMAVTDLASLSDEALLNLLY